MSKIIRTVALCLFFLLLSFASGAVVSNRWTESKHAGDTAKYETRLTELEHINSELQKANLRASELNQYVTDRLNRAAKILDGIESDADRDTEKIQRLIKNVRILEQAVSIIFE